MADMEKETDALLDEEEQGGQKAGAEAGEAQEKKPEEDPGETLRKLCRGKLKLMTPIRAHSQDVREVTFDFCDLTGMEMMDALDSVAMVNNMFGISNRQAIALFAATAEKCAPIFDDGGTRTRLYDAKDIREKLGAADSVKAMQLAKLFYNASSQAGNNNISKA